MGNQLTIREIVIATIYHLEDRKGFDAWWWRVDADTRREIVDSVVDEIAGISDGSEVNNITGQEEYLLSGEE